MTNPNQAAARHYREVEPELPDDAAGAELVAEEETGLDAMPGGPSRYYPNIRTMREATFAVFRDLQKSTKGPGQCPHYFDWARKNPTDFYKLAARLIPLQVEAETKTVGVLIVEGLND